MTVVGVIGMLAAIALPNMSRARENAQNGRFAGDIRVATGAFEMYYLENGRYPADSTPGIIPAGMDPFLEKINWTGTTSLGGQWDWDHMVFNVTAGVSVKSPDCSDDQIKRLDFLIDDGSLTEGQFRRRSGGFIRVIEF